MRDSLGLAKASVLLMVGLVAGVFLTYSAPKAEQGTRVTGFLRASNSTIIDVSASFQRAAFVEVSYEVAAVIKTQGPAQKAVMRIRGLPGEMAMMTCDVQNGGNLGTRRDCTGARRGASHSVIGEGRFGSEINFDGAFPGGPTGPDNRVEINVSYL